MTRSGASLEPVVNVDADSRIASLLARWEQLKAQSTRPSVEELCRDSPELTDEIWRRIWMLDTAGRGSDTEAAESLTIAGGESSSRARAIDAPLAIGRYRIVGRLGAGACLTGSWRTTLRRR
jgi:hypothetical protein